MTIIESGAPPVCEHQPGAAIRLDKVLFCCKTLLPRCTGRPEDSGIALQTVRELGPDFPIFGVCMGHQCIGQVFGGDVVRAPSGVMHGKTSPVHHKDLGLLKVSSHSARGCKQCSAPRVAPRCLTQLGARTLML